MYEFFANSLNFFRKLLFFLKKGKNMVFNQLDIHLLITAICVISSALICYTIGVWGERFQGQLKAWHLWFLY